MSGGVSAPVLAAGTSSIGVRLADYILRGRAQTKQAVALQDAIRSVQRIIVDEVDAMVWNEANDDKTWELSTDFPNVAPPLPAMWIESRVAPTNAMRNIGATLVGAWVQSWDLADAEGRTHWVEKTAPKLTGSRGEQWHLDDRIRWVLAARTYFLMPDGAGSAGASVAGGVTMFYPVTHAGQIPEPYGPAIHLPVTAIPVAHPDADPTDEQVERWTELYQFVNYTFLLAISLMHCKNVTLVERRASRQQRREAARKGQQEPYTFHTLDIEPMRRVLKAEGGSDTHGTRKALHICRGHFRDYRQHGLFGKVKGIYWFDSHVRGTADRVVEKQYRVHPDGTTRTPAGVIVPGRIEVPKDAEAIARAARVRE